MSKVKINGEEDFLILVNEFIEQIASSSNSVYTGLIIARFLQEVTEIAVDILSDSISDESLGKIIYVTRGNDSKKWEAEDSSVKESYIKSGIELRKL